MILKVWLLRFSWSGVWFLYEVDRRLSSFRISTIGDRQRVVLPFGVGVRFIITSADVIHSWTLPTMAAKVDANAGFINTINLTFEVPGVYYGQCREICGANHSFMPICVEVTSLTLFKSWLNLF